MLLTSKTQIDKYEQRVTSLTLNSNLFGPEFSRRLGFNQSPPYPQSALLGELFYDLTMIYRCGLNSAQKALLQQTSEELILGMWWVIKLEWNSKFKFPLPKKVKSKNVLKARTKPCGEWLQSVLHLAEKTITFSDFGSTDIGYASAAYWFHCIVKELAVTGGLSAVLPSLYPTSEPTELARLTGPGELNKEASIYRLHDACSQMKALDRPCGSGNLATLVRYGSQVAKKNDQFKKGAWNNFLKATRAYVKQMGTPEYQAAYIVESKSKGPEARQSRPGKGKGFQKMISRPV